MKQLHKTDLHIHLLQSLYPEDIYDLAENCYEKINWNRFHFLENFCKVFGYKPDPVKIFQQSHKEDVIESLKDIMTYDHSERGDFEKFNLRSFFPLCVTGYYFDKEDFDPVLELIVNRHKKAGISYIEYRNGVGFSEAFKDEWKAWHKSFAAFLKRSSDENFRAKYIMRISRDSYDAVKEFMEENPELKDTIVGIDFSGKEQAPKHHAEFFRTLEKDRDQNPQIALDAVVHIGEDFFDKSLESAIRWCHESALNGATRLGHCIALGIDPEIAIKRRINAHCHEKVDERIDQIEYDLTYAADLRKFGIQIDRDELIREKKNLLNKEPDSSIFHTYNKSRLEEIEKRQNFVLHQLKELETVIEVCPTSNLLIGGISDPQDHPVKKFIESGVNLAICTDDPGIFDTDLQREVKLVCKITGMNLQDLTQKMGDPYRFRLSQ